MKPKFLPLLERCITEGIERGYTRAHKYDEAPNEFVIKDQIYENIMHELYESFDFPELEYLNA